MTLSDRWDQHFLSLCEAHARMSKDPSTKVGSIIVGPDREIRSTGFNGFPRGIVDLEGRYRNRDLKYELIVHAELNAILAAARIGTSLRGGILYTSMPPCLRCAMHIIQAGIVEVVSRPIADTPERWREVAARAHGFLIEAGIKYREVPYNVRPYELSSGHPERSVDGSPD